MPKKIVVVAMSGGVDSSTAAAMLKSQGYDVIGVSMQLWDYSTIDAQEGSTVGSCCSLDDLCDARRVCDSLAVPFYVLNMEEAFKKEVVDYFIEDYFKGHTPNPCIKCNEVIKFELLLKKAMSLGADYLATGHYARIKKNGNANYLLKGVDKGKDQSYFLFTLKQNQLERLLFPLGNITKIEARRCAREFNLRVSEKKDSQEVCFINGSYANFLSNSVNAARPAPTHPTRPRGTPTHPFGWVPEHGSGFPATSPNEIEGEITDTKGNAIGAHKGLFRYTVGQRKRINIKDGAGPYYVISFDRKNNRLIVGKDAELYSNGLVATGLNWINNAPSNGDSVTAKIRYRHDGAEAVVSRNADSIEVIFSMPQRAITPGQAVVFYRGDTVIGGGWIQRAIP